MSNDGSSENSDPRERPQAPSGGAIYKGLAEIEERLGHTFAATDLLRKALTHRSFHFENRNISPGHNERLEFLGDSVLDLVLSEILMERFPEATEGTLSKWRASLVNETTLAEVARTLNLGRYMFLGKSETRGELRPRLLASGLEAVLAALYLDGGVEKIRRFVSLTFASKIENLDARNGYATDYKSSLQEWSQRKSRCLPHYRVLSAEGPDHAKIFSVEVYLNDDLVGAGRGNSRKSAEQDAAHDALSRLVKSEDEGSQGQEGEG